MAYAKQEPVATATALPPELPPAILQSAMQLDSLPSTVYDKSDFQTFLVGPNNESTVPDLGFQE